MKLCAAMLGGVALFAAVATSASAQEADPAAALYGTWESGRPADLGFGGTVWHSYHPDGTLTSNLNIVDSDSGCRTIWLLVGTFEDVGGFLTVSYDSGFGTTESAHCNDASMNEAERALTAEELDANNSTGVAWSIEGDALTLGDGVATHTRVHGPVVATVEGPAADLLGTWESGRPADIGFGGTVWHSYHGDGTLTSNVNIVDSESGCRTIWLLVGTFEDADGFLTVSYDSGFGTTEIAHCNDASMNEAERAFTAEELDANNSTGVAWSIEGDILTLGDGVATHARVH